MSQVTKTHYVYFFNKFIFLSCFIHFCVYNRILKQVYWGINRLRRFLFLFPMSFHVSEYTGPKFWGDVYRLLVDDVHFEWYHKVDFALSSRICFHPDDDERYSGWAMVFNQDRSDTFVVCFIPSNSRVGDIPKPVDRAMDPIFYEVEYVDEDQDICDLSREYWINDRFWSDYVVDVIREPTLSGSTRSGKRFRRAIL